MRQSIICDAQPCVCVLAVPRVWFTWQLPHSTSWDRHRRGRQGLLSIPEEWLWGVGGVQGHGVEGDNQALEIERWRRTSPRKGTERISKEPPAECDAIPLLFSVSLRL